MKDKNIEVIAEVKTQSPFGYRSKRKWDELLNVAISYGDMISIHTDARWGGSFSLVKKAKALTDKPILAKGIHESDSDIEAAIRHGADYVLVVGRVPNVFRDRCIIEPYDLEQLKNIPKEFKVVWNARDLKTGNQKKEEFYEARSLRDGWLCQASFIKYATDIEKGCNAILIGENLVGFFDDLNTE